MLCCNRNKGINGGLGAHRYPLIGSGDTEASWAMASYQMYMNIAGANLATAWTHGERPYIYYLLLPLSYLHLTLCCGVRRRLL